MAVPAILLPCDPLNPRRTDAHFAAEAQLVRDLGGDAVLIDHDALLAGDTEDAVRRVPHGLGPAWYRGWMVPSAGYGELARALLERGCTLLTSPAGYTAAHELPGWYGVFDGATPASVWRAGVPGAVELAEAAAQLGGKGPAIVKDYVKSRKEDWAEACFIPELADLAALQRVVARFVELQGEYLAGGVVLRVFETFAGPPWPAGPPDGDGAALRGGRAAEARVWWVDGEAVLVGPHPDTPLLLPDPDLTVVRPLVRALGCRFVTTDLALRADGSGWRVLEVGDGQVSDLPRGVDAAPMLAALIAS